MIHDNIQLIYLQLERAENAIEKARELLLEGQFVKSLLSIHEVVQEAKRARLYALDEDARRLAEQKEAVR